MKKNLIRKIILISIPVAVLIAAAIIYMVSKQPQNENFEYGKVEKVLEEADKVLENKYERFTLPDEIDVGPAKNAYIITTTEDVEEDIQEKTRKLSRKLYGVEPENIILDESHTKNCEAEVQVGDDIACFFYYVGGTFGCGFGYNTELADYYAEKAYLLGSDKTEGVSYKLKDGEMSVDGAVDMAYNYIKDNLMEFLPNNSDIKPVSVSVFKANETDYCYCVKLENVIEGIPVSSSGMAVPEEYTLFPQVVECWIYRGDRVEFFWNSYHRMIGEKEKVGKIITLESAFENLDKELAPNINYKFLNISLKYCCRTEDNNSSEFEYRPTWCFVTASYNGTNAMLNPQVVVYVDAVSGEIYCFDGNTGRFVF